MRIETKFSLDQKPGAADGEIRFKSVDFTPAKDGKPASTIGGAGDNDIYKLSDYPGPVQDLVDLKKAIHVVTETIRKKVQGVE